MIPPPRPLSDYSTDELLYELLRLTRRQQWEADPLRFGCEAFVQHFSKPPARLHQAMLGAATGQLAGVEESNPHMNTLLPFSPSVSDPMAVPPQANG